MFVGSWMPVVLAVALLSTGISLLLTTTPLSGNPNYYSLTSHGYVYPPEGPDWLKVKVKLCYDLHVAFFQDDEVPTNVYQVILVGWGSSRNAISYLDNAGIETLTWNYNVAGLLSCTEYKKVWFSWRNSTFTVGHGGELFENVIMTRVHTGEQPLRIRYIGVYGGRHNNAYWDLPDLGYIHCFKANTKQWKLLFMNTNMTLDIVWTIDVTRMYKCAAACKLNRGCVSFTYSTNDNKCQGHGSNFDTKAMGQGQACTGCMYYINV